MLELDEEIIDEESQPEEIDEQADATDEKEGQAEAEARLLGWRPKEEFVGDKDRWRSAEEFLQHGKDTLPILRENNKRLMKELQEFKGTFKEFVEHHKATIKKTEERAYQKALKDIREEQRKAVEESDIEKFEALERQKEELKLPEENEFVKPPNTPAKDPVLVQWESENQWYGGDGDDDLIMTARADQLAAVLHNKGVALDDMLPRIKACIKKEYPDYFTNKRAKNAPSVDTPSRQPGGDNSKKGKTFNDLPEDAKIACRKYVKQGFKQEDYLKDYFGEE